MRRSMRTKLGSKSFNDLDDSGHLTSPGKRSARFSSSDGTSYGHRTIRSSLSFGGLLGSMGGSSSVGGGQVTNLFPCVRVELSSVGGGGGDRPPLIRNKNMDTACVWRNVDGTTPWVYTSQSLYVVCVFSSRFSEKQRKTEEGGGVSAGSPLNVSKEGLIQHGFVASKATGLRRHDYLPAFVTPPSPFRRQHDSRRDSNNNTGRSCPEGGRWQSRLPRSRRRLLRAPVSSRPSRRAPPLPSSRRRKREAARRAAAERPQARRAAGAAVFLAGGARLEGVPLLLVWCRMIARRP